MPFSLRLEIEEIMSTPQGTRLSELYTHVEDPARAGTHHTCEHMADP